jgi:hypothetical protein
MARRSISLAATGPCARASRRSATAAAVRLSLDGFGKPALCFNVRKIQRAPDYPAAPPIVGGIGDRPSLLAIIPGAIVMTLTLVPLRCHSGAPTRSEGEPGIHHSTTLETGFPGSPLRGAPE